MRSWFENMFATKKERRHRISVDDDGQTHIRSEIFQGTWDDAEKAMGPLADGLNKVMTYAMNNGDEVRGGVREPGDKMVFQMKGVEVEARERNAKGRIIEPKIDLGDYEIEVRRVR